MVSSKPFFGFGWIETCQNEGKGYEQFSSKPFFGFGWIETPPRSYNRSVFCLSSKPFFGFGWIETAVFSL